MPDRHWIDSTTVPAAGHQGWGLIIAGFGSAVSSAETRPSPNAASPEPPNDARDRSTGGRHLGWHHAPTIEPAAPCGTYVGEGLTPSRPRTFGQEVTSW